MVWYLFEGNASTAPVIQTFTIGILIRLYTTTPSLSHREIVLRTARLCTVLCFGVMFERAAARFGVDDISCDVQIRILPTELIFVNIDAGIALRLLIFSIFINMNSKTG